MTTNHYFQPSGNLCGPTCIFMVSRLLSSRDDKNHEMTESKVNFLIEEIGEVCGTDWVVGTPPERMVKGFNFMKLKFVEFQNSPRPFELIKSSLDVGNYNILRTITKGVPHWIVVVGYDDLGYHVFDSWLGIIRYSEIELDSIWSPRFYQFYEIYKYL